MDPSRLTGQALLAHTIHTTPIIDNHAHPLLNLESIGRYPLLSITTEAHGDAIHASLTSLAHLRAVKQLSQVLHCEPRWEAVVNAIEQRRIEGYDEWVEKCLSGIETVLVDDGLDSDNDVHPYAYFSAVTRSPAKRIVRIEKVAAKIINANLPGPSADASDMVAAGLAFDKIIEEFDLEITGAITDQEVAGFKSVICYRTGLAIPRKPDATPAKKAFEAIYSSGAGKTETPFTRVDHPGLNEYLVHRLACLIRDTSGIGTKKPIQFHTGLGDNDITLTSSSPSHLQEFIREYPTVPIVLLHASYPYTREAGYLASVYANVYADVGEVFPFLSRDGQESVIRQILELCPWSKILWSTDGHWFPETYYLAIVQVKEVLLKVLSDYARKGHMTWKEASQAVKDILFRNSNHLYRLRLELVPNEPSAPPRELYERSDLDLLETFLEGRSLPKYLRIYWNDYTATQRMRAIPIRKVFSLLREEGYFSIGITKASLGLLQNDLVVAPDLAIGEYRLHPDFSSLREGPRDGHISVFGDFREQDGSQVAICPRSLLQRVVDNAAKHGLAFQIGFEVELLLVERSKDPKGNVKYQTLDNDGHAWSVGRAQDHPVVSRVLEKAIEILESHGVFLEQFHPESAAGQYEVILPKAPPLEAIDTLLHVREVISATAAAEGYRMTLHPKPFPTSCGTASHVHMSISSPGGSRPDVYLPFYAGILKHLRGLLAFTYSNPVSYDRAQDGCWAGGRWVTWGTQNREAALRKIEDSHWEMKTLDGLANPYLSIAAVLAAGSYGVMRKEKMIWGDCEADPAALTTNDRKELGISEMLPASLDEALFALQEDAELCGLIGEDVVERYVLVKKAELKSLETIGKEDRRDWLIERY